MSLAGPPATDGLWSYWYPQGNVESDLVTSIVGGDSDILAVSRVDGLMALEVATGRPLWPNVVPYPAPRGDDYPFALPRTACVMANTDSLGCLLPSAGGLTPIFFDARTGQERGRGEEVSDKSSQIHSAAGKYIVSTGSGVTAYRPDGQVAWQSEVKSYLDTMIFDDQGLVMVDRRSVLDAATGNTLYSGGFTDGVAYTNGFGLETFNGVELYDMTGRRTAELTDRNTRLLTTQDRERYTYTYLPPTGLDVPLVYTQSGQLTALDLPTGKPLWSRAGQGGTWNTAYAESNGPTCRIYYSDGREKYMLMQTCREDSGHPFISLGDYYESNVLGSAGDTVLVKNGVLRSTSRAETRARSCTIPRVQRYPRPD